MPLPDGESHQFHTTTGLQVAIIVVHATTFIFATILMGFRLYTSVCIVRKIDLDDRKFASGLCKRSTLLRRLVNSAHIVSLDSYPGVLGRHDDM
jgi:hypothetical protein